MREHATAFAAEHGQKILLAVVVLGLVTLGATGEALAHNPAGVAVPGCENGADAVAHTNPNCHK